MCQRYKQASLKANTLNQELIRFCQTTNPIEAIELLTHFMASNEELETGEKRIIHSVIRVLCAIEQNPEPKEEAAA
ncbi:MAG: hypothetical protein EOP45_03075 [Sphingobacteriaceae bacterium]|nr:MAG: hypothetical protein EOP45_03075 [Sphingobacteriaceae bacterium]